MIVGDSVKFVERIIGYNVDDIAVIVDEEVTTWWPNTSKITLELAESFLSAGVVIEV